jgi:hypothetical protein
MEFPYEYGSDLHWLWGWGYRIEVRMADTKRGLHEYDCLVFRPDTTARDAMTRFSVAYQYPIKAIDDCLTFVEQRFAEFLHDPANIGSFEMAFLSLSERIAAGVAVIAKAEAAKKPTGGKSRKAKPKRVGKFTNAEQTIIATLLLHHQYDSPQGDGFSNIGSTEAASYRELCELSEVKSTGTIRSFFHKWFPNGGNAEYKRICRSGDAKKLSLELARLVPGDTPEFSSLYIDKEA